MTRIYADKGISYPHKSAKSAVKIFFACAFPAIGNPGENTDSNSRAEQDWDAIQFEDNGQ